MIAKLGTWAAKLLGFFVFCFAFWKWGQVSAELKEVKKERDEAEQRSQKIVDNNSLPYVDDPAMCLYDIAEDDLPGDGKV